MKLFGMELFSGGGDYEAVCQGEPSGNGGINGEGRTRQQIVARPLTPALERGIVSFCQARGIDARAVVRFFGDGSGWRVPRPAVNGHVDFSCCSRTLRARCASTAQIRQYCAERRIPVDARHAFEIKTAIRQLNYDLARDELARLFRCSLSDAGRLIGMADYAIHETDDGHLQMVPNNIHRDRSVYAHSGYVAHTVKTLTGADIED